MANLKIRVSINRKARSSPMWIYILIDPRTGKAKYVGVTARPRHRFVIHMRQPKNRPQPVDIWISSLLQIGQKPICKIVGKVISYCGFASVLAHGAERGVIRLLDFINHGQDTLTNVAGTRRQKPAKAGKRSREYRQSIGRTPSRARKPAVVTS